MKTVADVMKYCEGRSGVRLESGFFIPSGGGGLYGLEVEATKSGHHSLAYEYKQQRAELQLLMYEISKGQ